MVVCRIVGLRNIATREDGVASLSHNSVEVEYVLHLRRWALPPANSSIVCVRCCWTSILARPFQLYALVLLLGYLDNGFLFLMLPVDCFIDHEVSIYKSPWLPSGDVRADD